MGADRISQGPPSVAGTSQFDEPGAIIIDAVSGAEYIVSNSRQLSVGQAAMLVLAAQTALVTITTAQTLLSLALAAGQLNAAKRTILVTGFVIFTTPAGTPTITIAILLGATTLCTITTAAVAGSQTAAQLQFQFELTVTTTGAAGSIETHGTVSAQLSAALGTAAPTYMDQNAAAVGSLNLPAAQTLSVTIAASTTVTSAQLRMAAVELVA